MLINCGHQCVTGDYSWDGMRRGRHDMVIWQYTLAGMGRLRFGELEYPVPPGRAMLLIAPENHCYFLPDDSRGWEFLYVSFHGSEAVRLAGECRRRSGVINDFSADSPAPERFGDGDILNERVGHPVGDRPPHADQPAVAERTDRHRGACHRRNDKTGWIFLADPTGFPVQPGKLLFRFRRKSAEPAIFHCFTHAHCTK